MNCKQNPTTLLCYNELRNLSSIPERKGFHERTAEHLPRRNANFLYVGAQGSEKCPRPEEIPVLEAVNGYKQKFIDAMDDDLNTADAISAIFEIVSEVNKNITSASEPSEYLIEYILSVFDELGSVLGILGRKEKETVPDEVKEMLEERKNARADKDWAKSDLIRDKLKDFGYSVKDTAQGQQLIKL